MKRQAYRLIVSRLGLALLTLLIVSAIVFAMTGLLPGDAAQQALGQAATPEAVAALRHQFGLDQPALQRYLEWLFHIVGGDFGMSLSNSLPVNDLIATRLPNSLMLAGLTTVVAVPVALAIGILSAMYRGSLLDRILNLLTLSTVAVPEFLVATIAVLIFAVNLHWLPALSYLSSVSSFARSASMVFNASAVFLPFTGMMRVSSASTKVWSNFASSVSGSTRWVEPA